MKKIKDPIFVTKPFLPPIEEYYEEMKEIWESKWLTNNGVKHKKLRERLKNHLNINHLSLFVNGTLALDLAVKALDLKGEVITTPFTFPATSHKIVSNNLKPVFCDIELDTLNIDSEKIENLVTSETSAILPVHIFGNPANVKEISRIADKYDLKVIYDAAQAFGVEIGGKSIAEFGDVSMFSFHATKVFHSIEGGMLTYKENRLKDKFEQLKNFGLNDNKTIKAIGTNAKMNEFQAIMGLLNLKYYQQEIEARKKVAAKYKKRFDKIQGISYLKDKPNVKYNYAYFPIIVEDNFSKSRDGLLEELNKKNVFPRKYYSLCSNYECYDKDQIRTSKLINAEYVERRILSLPIYGALTNEEINYICNIIKESNRN